MKLPLLLSVPHAGTIVPPEARAYCRLTHEEIVADGDEYSQAIYALGDHVAHFMTTQTARAIVDLNRAQDDFRRDGVIKTHTCWNVPVYDQPLPLQVVQTLLEQHYYPYHESLTQLAGEQIRLAVDCHTMAASGPPVGPDTGQTRPMVCLGDVNGTTVPPEWMALLVESFGDAFQCEIAVNRPFAGGHITRTHGLEMPWLQVELSRAPFLTPAEKRDRVLESLERFCMRINAKSSS